MVRRRGKKRNTCMFLYIYSMMSVYDITRRNNMHGRCECESVAKALLRHKTWGSGRTSKWYHIFCQFESMQKGHFRPSYIRTQTVRCVLAINEMIQVAVPTTGLSPCSLISASKAPVHAEKGVMTDHVSCVMSFPIRNSVQYVTIANSATLA